MRWEHHVILTFRLRIGSVLDLQPTVPIALVGAQLALHDDPYEIAPANLLEECLAASPEYSFQLATEMLASKVVVGMRSKKHWLNAVPAVENVSFLKNPRNPHISPANTGAELFQRIVEALR